LKDFLTVWIGLGGVGAVVVGIFQTHSRMAQQEKQFNEQKTLQLKEQRDARFASGVELLGNPHESTRIGGAYNLYFLAREFPDDYLNPVCEILCAHLRSIAHKDNFKTDEQREKYPRDEVQTAIDLLFSERDGQTLFKGSGPKNLRETFFFNIGFEKAESDAAIFCWKAELKSVGFEYAKLSGVYFGDATLRDTRFDNAELHNASFIKSKLTNVTFCSSALNSGNFHKAKLINVDFSLAQIEKTIPFEETKLEGFEIDEIVRLGRSQELTAEKEYVENQGDWYG